MLDGSSTTTALMYHGLGAPPGPAVDPHYSVDVARFAGHARGSAKVAAKHSAAK